MEQIRLRKLCKNDAEGMLEWMSDPKLNQYFMFDTSNLSILEVQKWIENSKLQAERKTTFHFAIVNKEDEYLGTISLKNIDFQIQAAEYAIALRKIAQGQGIAAEATQQLLMFAFTELKLNRIYLNVLPENHSAIAMYEKCGFIYEGELREHFYIRGEVKSQKCYGILKSDYIK